ncbi:MAG TPA: hypothetical protein VFI47_04255, partial [Acidimicrobiales bacterium]|nr:hypothetical protein [Acidimicrobiales bacterium]
MEVGAQAGERARVAILWQGMSGYAHAAFTRLAARDVDVMVFHKAGDGTAPFEADAVTRGLQARAWSGAPDAGEVEAAVARFAPHALLVSSWHIDAYRRAARRR